MVYVQEDDDDNMVCVQEDNNDDNMVYVQEVMMITWCMYRK